MVVDRQDRRVQKTRHLFQEALIKLLEENRYSSISIEDLADQANLEVFPPPNPPRFQAGDTGGGNRINRKDNIRAHELEQTVYNRVCRINEWKTTGNAVYNTGYHFVWSVKYRRQVLRAPIDQTVKEVLAEICQEKGYRWLAMEGMPRHVCRDHLPIFVSAPPKISPAEIARFLRGSSARYLFQHHPELKRWLWGGHLWNPSYYVGTARHVSAETIQKYIENQK